jgi:hypothetical protein
VTPHTGFGLEIRFIDDFNTRLVTTLNYSAIANLHTLPITRTHGKSFPACNVFTSRSLIMASNSGDSSTAPSKSSLHRLPYNSLSLAPFVFLITSRYGPRRKHRSLVYSYRSRGNMFVCEGVTQ